jgi:hypothetical protein
MLSQEQECTDGSLYILYQGFPDFSLAYDQMKFNFLNVPPVCFFIEHTKRKLERLADSGVN